MLRVERVCAGYGRTVVLEQVSFEVRAGSAVAILGRNGVGKTTLLSTIMGHTSLHAGTIAFGGADIARAPAHVRARSGIGFVPQTRRIFRSLTVAENLAVAGRPGAWNAARIYELFPNLAERRRNMGNHLSGGEQQMLAIGRALMGNPAVLLMDEPFEGLAPVIVDHLVGVLKKLRVAGEPSIVLVEQHTRAALELTDSALVLDRGQVVFDGSSRSLLDAPQRLDALIGVSAH
jgi:branched-chain amino acid transport system ATP-binding protein